MFEGSLPSGAQMRLRNIDSANLCYAHEVSTLAGRMGLLSMAVDHIRYDILAQEALRGVVRSVLRGVAKDGLPGDHHFYISFDTRADGVRLSARMLEQYPEEMTVVLQHQFWDLLVTDDGFEVGVSFDGIPERLAVPFAAVKGFFDPSVQFGLRFEEMSGPGEDARKEETAAAGSKRDPEVPSVEPKRTAAALTAVPASASAGQSEVAEDGTDKSAGTSGDVVRLDRFRKK
jgi:hypothetical protein